MTPTIIKYAYHNASGKTIHINTASNGLSCNCNCENCEQQMVAVQGKSENHREWHFRHYIDSDCEGGQETAIHKLAKQIIADNTEISIPGSTLKYFNARQEVKFHTIIPDVTVSSDFGDIHFEIEVKNPVNNEKESFYKKGQYKSIKINLKGIPLDILPEHLEEIVLRQIDNKTKIFWEIESKPSPESSNNTFFDSIIQIALFLLGLFMLDRIFFKKKRR